MPLRRLAWAIGLVAAPAAAQDGKQAEIVVIAPGGAVDSDEALAIDGEAIDQGARPDLAGALQRDVPGVSIAEAQGNPWQAAINWRGYGVSALQGTEQGMAVYLDGIRFNQPFGDTLSLDLLPEAALDRAEIRDASPVYGRNALGGALLLSTAKRRESFGGEASLGGDSDGGYGGSLSVGGKQGLLVIEGLHDAGWRDDSPSRLFRLFGSAILDGPGWGVNANVIAADTRLNGNGVAPVELLAADYGAVFTKPDITRSRFWRVAALPHVDIGENGRIEATLHYQRLRRDSENGDLADFDACNADPSILCLAEDDAGFIDPLRDAATGAILAVDPAIDQYAARNLGHEVTCGGGASVQWLDERETTIGTRRLSIGVAWESYRTEFTANSELAELLQPSRDVTGLGPLLASDNGGITPVSATSKLRDLAVFASAEIPLLPRLSTEVGARWSDNRVELIDRTGTALDGTHRFRRLSPSIEFDYRPGDAWSLSAGFAETSRNPTPAELSCADPEAPCALANFFIADPPLVPVVAHNWHAEARFEHGPFTAHLGLWRSDSRNDIRHIASTVRGRAYFANLGRSRRQGFDAAIGWRSGPWRLGADYTLTGARFRTAFAISSPANPAADDEGVIEVETGDRLPNVPRHAANLRAGYEAGDWGLEAAMRLRSSQVLVGDEGNDNPPIPGYAVFDLTGHMALAPQVTLVVEARNLLDRRYATFGTFSEVNDIALAEAPDASDPRAYAPGMARRVSAAVRFAF